MASARRHPPAIRSAAQHDAQEVRVELVHRAAEATLLGWVAEATTT